MRLLTPVLLLITAWASHGAEAKKEISWQHQFEEALALAKALGKPLLLDFRADWCAPCKRMDSEVWPEERLNAQADRYIFVSINIDRDSGTKNRYQVHAIPTIVVADPWGHAVQSHTGFIGSAQVLDMLGQLPSDYGEVRESYDILEHDPKNGKALYRIGQFYADRHGFHLSSEFYKNALKSDLAKEDADFREDVTLGIALNDFRDGNTNGAQKKLDLFQKTFPNGRRQAEALLAELAVAIRQHKLSVAGTILQQLQQRFPDSQATANAKAMLAQAK